MVNFKESFLKVIESHWESLLLFLPKFIAGLIVLLITIFIGIRIGKAVMRSLEKHMKDKLLPRFLGRLSKWGFIVLGIALAADTMGFGGLAGGILASAGVTAVVLGFALRDIGENFIAGVVLAFKRPFNVGDTIQTGSYIGKIEAIDLRSAHLRTFDGKDVFIPNSQIFKNPLINFTKDGLIRYEFGLTIALDKDEEKITQLILSELRKIEGVLPEPPTLVAIDELTPAGMRLKVYFWINAFETKDSLILRSNVIRRTKKVLLGEGLLS